MLQDPFDGLSVIVPAALYSYHFSPHSGFMQTPLLV